MNKKLYLIVIFAIIITTLSQTVSLVIDREHSFYSNQSMESKCPKCHGNIQEQLTTSIAHTSDSCTDCHGNATPECSTCHSQVISNLTNSSEAHNILYASSLNDTFMFNASESCVSCHTTYNANTSYSRPEYISFNSTNETGNWNVTDFTAGSPQSFSGSVSRNGGNHNLKNVACEDCHQDIFDAASNSSSHASYLTENNVTAYHDNASSSIWCESCHSTSYDPVNYSIQHAARDITCDECHQSLDNHPGNLYANIQTSSVPREYRSFVCIACKKSLPWINLSAEPAQNFTLYVD